MENVTPKTRRTRELFFFHTLLFPETQSVSQGSNNHRVQSPDQEDCLVIGCTTPSGKQEMRTRDSCEGKNNDDDRSV